MSLTLATLSEPMAWPAKSCGWSRPLPAWEPDEYQGGTTPPCADDGPEDCSIASWCCTLATTGDKVGMSGLPVPFGTPLRAGDASAACCCDADGAVGACTASAAAAEGSWGSCWVLAVGSGVVRTCTASTATGGACAGSATRCCCCCCCCASAAAAAAGACAGAGAGGGLDAEDSRCSAAGLLLVEVVAAGAADGAAADDARGRASAGSAAPKHAQSGIARSASSRPSCHALKSSRVAAADARGRTRSSCSRCSCYARTQGESHDVAILHEQGLGMDDVRATCPWRSAGGAAQNARRTRSGPTLPLCRTWGSLKQRQGTAQRRRVRDRVWEQPQQQAL